MPNDEDDVNSATIPVPTYERRDLKQMCAVHGVSTCDDTCPHRLHAAPAQTAPNDAELVDIGKTAASYEDFVAWWRNAFTAPPPATATEAMDLITEAAKRESAGRR